MFSYAAPLGLLLVVVITVATIWSGHLNNRGRGMLWGLWGVGMVAALSGIGLCGYYGWAFSFHGFSQSLTGMEKLAGLMYIVLAVVAFGIAAGSYLLVKKKLKAPVARISVWIGIGLGSLAILLSSYLIESTQRENWTVVVRDEDRHPIEGATVLWQIYEYDHPKNDPYASKPNQPIEIGGPRKTDAAGKAVLPSWAGTYEMFGAVERTGYAPIKFEIGMAFENHDSRDFSFKNESNRRVGGSASLPKQGPFSFAIFMPSEKTLREHVEDRTTAWYLTLGEPQARTLSLWTFPDGQVHRVSAWIEKYKDERGFERMQIRFVGLDGLRFCPRQKGRRWATAEDARSMDFLQVAPETGYEPNFDFKSRDFRQDYFQVYAKTADGRYAELSIYKVQLADILGHKDVHDGTFEANVSWNTDGGRSFYNAGSTLRKLPAVQ